MDHEEQLAHLHRAKKLLNNVGAALTDAGSPADDAVAALQAHADGAIAAVAEAMTAEAAAATAAAAAQAESIAIGVPTATVTAQGT